MAEMVMRQHVAAPPAEVFARASDFSRAAEVVSGITRVEMLTPGTVGLGTKFRETRVMFGKEANEVMEVVEWQPARRYALGALSCGTKYHSAFDFAPVDGGTEVTMTFRAEPQTLTAKLMGAVMRPMMAGMVRKCVAQDLLDIKKACERSAAE